MGDRMNESTAGGDGFQPSDEELYEYVEGTLPPARAQQIAAAVAANPDLMQLLADSQTGRRSLHDYATTRVPMDTAGGLHRALADAWQSPAASTASRSAAPVPRTRPTAAPKVSRPARPARNRPWSWRPVLKVAAGFAVVAALAGVGVVGAKLTNQKNAPTTATSPTGPAVNEAATPQVGGADAATSKAVDGDTAASGTAAVAASPESSSDNLQAQPRTGATSTAGGVVPPEATSPAGTSARTTDLAKRPVACILVSSTVPVPVAGPANPVLGEVKRAISADFTIAPLRIDCKF